MTEGLIKDKDCGADVAEDLHRQVGMDELVEGRTDRQTDQKDLDSVIEVISIPIKLIGKPIQAYKRMSQQKLHIINSEAPLLPPCFEKC